VNKVSASYFLTDGTPQQALNSVSFSVPPGAFVTLIGPSGCGKSTLFHVIAGLTEPESGNIQMDGLPAPSRLGRSGYMPQRDLLLPWRSVLHNAILPLEVRGLPRREAEDRARALLDRFGLAGYADEYPAALSGGMRQRAALLRTLLTDQELLLLDEPFGALDAITRWEMQDWLLEVWQEFGRTVLFITHDVEEALYLADRVIVFSGRPGSVVKEVEVDLPRPRRREMIASAGFRRQVRQLISALGVAS
jgi:ABC-type nitrate/sulfonate/bicarbonate transport system ATPase subunit